MIKLTDEERLEERNEGKKEGLKEGKKEGLKEGKKEKAFEIAKNLLIMDVDTKTIIKATGLSADEINSIS